MRLVMDSLIALMLVVVLGGLLLHQRYQDRALADLQFVHRALAQLQEQTIYHATLDAVSLDAEQGALGQMPFPLLIHSDWFVDTLPVNLLVGADHPWIDVAPGGDLASHPPDPTIRQRGQAGFWYNPNTGIFRARVKPQDTDRQTLEIYNQVNGCALSVLPRTRDAARQPLAMALDIPSTTLHASLARTDVAKPTQQPLSPPSEEVKPDPSDNAEAPRQTLRALQTSPKTLPMPKRR